jgi:hypothetical protein
MFVIRDNQSKAPHGCYTQKTSEDILLAWREIRSRGEAEEKQREEMRGLSM